MKSITPNRREILSARSTITGQAEYLTSTLGALNTSTNITAWGGGTVKLDPNGYPYFTLGTAIAGEDPVNNSLHVEGTSITLSGSGSLTNDDLIPSTEVLAAGFGRYSLQISGTWTGTITISCSNDNTTFSNALAFNNASAAAVGAASITGNGNYFGYINFKYIRVRLTTATSGTATATLALASAPGGQQTIGVQATQSGTWNFGPVIAGSSAVTVVPGATSSTTLLASNTNRKQAFFFNDSASALYLKFGTAAATTSFTVKMAAGGYFELPTPPIYSAIVTGIWDTAIGDVKVTEVT